MTDEPGLTLTDIQEAERFDVLGPAYFAARRASEALFSGATDDPFKAMADKVAKHLRDELYDYAENFILGDLERNIAGRVTAMVDDTVKALLSGQDWALNRYALATAYDGAEVRAAICKHAGESLLTLRIAELEAQVIQQRNAIASLRERY